MNTVNIGNYREHNLYPKVVRATARLLMETDEISPVTILVQMGNLTPKDLDSWRRGNVSYLDEATRDVISRAVHRDLSEAAEIPGLGDAVE